MTWAFVLCPSLRSGGGELVGQDVGVGGHDGVAHFDRPSVGVVGGADEMDDRHAGGQAQRPHLGGRGHPCPDLLVEAVEAVSELFEAGVDAAGPGVGFGDPGSPGDVDGQVGGGELDGPPVEQVPAPAGQHPPYGGSQADGDVPPGLLLLDLQAVHLGVAACGVGFDEEGGLALFAVASGEAVGGEAPYRLPGPDEDAPAVLGVDESFALEYGEGVAHGHPGYPVVLDEFGLGGQLLALAEPSAVDGLAQLVGDLPEDRTVARGVHGAEPPRE